MSLFPLKYPPGVFRNGTRYQAKGRWFDANLVRWHEGTMQPLGGWQKLKDSNGVDLDLNEVIRGVLAWTDNTLKPRLALGTPTRVQVFLEGVLSDITSSAVSAAVFDSDGASTFSDKTAVVNSPASGDFQTPPGAIELDAFYFGLVVPFGAVRINMDVAATGGAVVWEYWDGTAWSALAGIVDGTNNLNVSGLSTVTFTIPSDWVATTINGQGVFYYVRARTTVLSTSNGIGTQGWCESGITAGQTDASTATGNYGQGAYGASNYGVGDPALGTLIEATSWQFDTFGQFLVATSIKDRRLYVWKLSTPPDGLLEPIPGAPVSNNGLVVTPERFLFALGAGGDGRTITWADQESLTDWTATILNQAGSFPISSNGALLAGRRGKNETLLWTEVDMWVARYVGGQLVYSFHQMGSQCGAISRHAMALVDAQAFWMGLRGFFVYNGFVQGVPSEVSDHIFNDINRTQASKIFAISLAEFREIIWFYPSAGSMENDRYVIYNWGGRTWSIGKLERTAGVDRGVFSYPIMTDASGSVYDQERGEGYLDTDDVTTLKPSAEGGPVEIKGGNLVYDLLYLIPDEKTSGDVEAIFFTSYFPNEPEVQSPTFALSKQTSVRLNGRQIRMKIQQVKPGWRFGIARFEVEPGGRR